MAQKRMFSLAVIDTDKFLEMPASAQCLYFHLGMHGDDDGFVASPKKIARAVGSCDDDLRNLINKGYIIPFQSGVIVITDWNINNTLKNDRYKATVYQDEKSHLHVQNGRYFLADESMDTYWNQSVSKTEPQRNLTQRNETEQNEDKREGADKPPKRARFVPPSEQEIIAYFLEIGSTASEAGAFYDFYGANGWVQGKGKPIKDWHRAASGWVRKAGQYQHKEAVSVADKYSML